MDTVTHALVGAAISDSYFRKRLGPLATPFALVVGALPDIDAVTYLFAPELAWSYHRGITHSFLPIVLAAPVLGFVGHRLSRGGGGFARWTLLALLCLLAHTLVDLATSWGTMPFLPFSDARISWDLAPILDVFYFSAAALSFVVNRALRWEKTDTFLNPLIYPVTHRHPRRQRVGDWIGKATVFLLIAYMGIAVHQNWQTVRIARQELAKAGVEAVEVRALPLMFTYISYAVAARDAEGTVYNAVYSSYAPRPMEFTRYPTRKGELVSRAAATREGRMFAWYTQGMLVAGEERSELGTRVTFSDRRFFGLSHPEQSRFTMGFGFDSDGVLVSRGARQMGFDGVDIREELARLWNLTWHGEALVELPEK